MPANFVSAFVVGHLLEDRYHLERRDAFLYALLPQFAGLPEVPGLVLSIALGKRHEPPPPAPVYSVATPPADSSTGTASPGTAPADRPSTGNASTGNAATGTAAPAKTAVVPDLNGASRSTAESKVKEAGLVLAFDTGSPTDGSVTEQNPAADTKVELGSTVTVKMRPGK